MRQVQLDFPEFHQLPVCHPHHSILEAQKIPEDQDLLDRLEVPECLDLHLLRPFHAARATLELQLKSK